MKAKKLFLLVAFLLSIQVVNAESYQRWIYWVNESSHDVTTGEMADITAALGRKEISANNIYRLSTGVTYKIPQPSLYLEYIIKCVQVADPSVKTAADAVNSFLSKGDTTTWGNDISCKVKNYYFSSLHNRVQFNDNYSGVSQKVKIIVINGAPVIKRDCGNTLEAINFTPKVKTENTPPAQNTPPPPHKDDYWGDYKSPQKLVKQRQLNLYLPTKETTVVVSKKDHALLWLAGVAITSAALYFTFRDKDNVIVAPPVDNGGPAGAPGYPAVTTTGGPSGSPGYSSNLFRPNPNFNHTNFNFTGKRMIGFGIAIHF